MIKNILITGGAGYIGSHIVEYLIKKEFKIFILDNLSTGHKKLLNKKCKFFKKDLKKSKGLKEIILENKIHSIIHLAASLDVNESEKNPSKYIANNVKSTLNLINACKDSLVTCFIFSSTAAVYKDGIYKVNEKSFTKPKSIYGKTKLKSEKLIKNAFNNSKINYAILRFFNVCGASTSKKIGQINSYDLLFKNLASAILTKKPKINIYGNDYKTKDGTCIRDFIHVSDLAIVHEKLLNKINKLKKSTTLNVGYGFGTSVLEVVKSFEKYSKKKIKIIFYPKRKADLKQIIADNTKIKKFLNWKPKYNKLSIMVRSSISWEKKLFNL